MFVCLQILEQDQKTINDERVKFESLSSHEPHHMSYYGPDSFGFQTIKKTVRQIWGSKDVIVSAGVHCSTLISLCCFGADIGSIHDYICTHNILQFVNIKCSKYRIVPNKAKMHRMLTMAVLSVLSFTVNYIEKITKTHLLVLISAMEQVSVIQLQEPELS